MLQKHLLLLRHAKSDWSGAYGSDRERPLAPRGIRAAKSVGEWLAAGDWAPDLVLTSPAVRARTTAELVHSAGGWAAPIEEEPDFYGAGGDAVLDCVRACPEEIGTVMVVGHEPTWSSLTGALIGGGTLRFPTTAVACVRFYGEWSKVARGGGELRWFVTPKLLARSGFPHRD